ncbi:MAG: HAD-IIIA family hydrolase [Gammaproteobacteria bacterium]|nr:HAD-IIIA family hydrolase [Gammaproteobacteria bacterium]
MTDATHRAARVRLVIFDVDGVLTDGRLYYGPDGEEYKAFFSRDGYGLRLLRRSGVEIGVISGRDSRAVDARMGSLGIQHVYQGRLEKLEAFEQLLGGLGLADEQACYVGDDVLDLPPMTRAGLAVAVADAHPLVLEHAHWRTPSPGGRGAGRDVCEFILRAQGRLDDLYARYLP